MTVIIISGGIDLSVGSVIALSGVIAALGIREDCLPNSRFVLGLSADCWLDSSTPWSLPASG